MGSFDHRLLALWRSHISGDRHNVNAVCRADRSRRRLESLRAPRVENQINTFGSQSLCTATAKPL